MKLPNNIADFGLIRKENYLYIDKTGYISELERMGRYLFFIRPRRFGKSLFLSMLEHYYDVEREDEFSTLFGGLQIGEQPTSLKNTYLILKMNFSGLDTTTHEGLRESFDDRVSGSLVRFFTYYRSYFTKVDEIIEELKKASSTKRMEILFNEVAESGYKIYLIIDEYDHFANDIIAMGDGQYYHDIVRASGFVRDFYETIKIGTQGIIDRIFMTGITPIMLDDLTSGFNITTNITTIPTINEMLGFTGRELESILEEIPQVRNQKKITQELRVYYNGYQFNAKAQERVYNPHMVLFFLQQWIITGDYPEQLIDDNVKTDYGRLNRLIANDKNQGMLDKIIKEEGIVTELVSRFSFDQMYDREYFVSLLFYMGLLTIQGSSYGMTRLCIPNYVIKTIYWEYIERKLKEEYQIEYETEELRKTIWQMAYEGKVEPFFEFVQTHVLSVLSNRDLIQFDEKSLKMILLTLLGPAKFYKAISERETENGYMDIFLERDLRFPDVKYEWIWELKYVKKGERGELERVVQEGLAQLARYGQSAQLQGRQNVKTLLIVFVGKNEYLLYR